MAAEVLNDRYRIERRLGGGSQAEVYLAHDLHMERLVAIKIWKPEGGFTIDEFLREAKLLARFGAPHFVTIHDYAATSDQRPFFVLEYLEGDTLHDLSAPLSPRELRTCVRDVCIGMQKAHDAGIVHRDIKPSNIMAVGRGTRSERYVILDLGIAKITNSANWRRTLADATMAGAGTLLYMSPEQCNGASVDARTDVYAFGCVLFQLLVNEEPFAHKAVSQISVLAAILNDAPRSLRDVRPDLPIPDDVDQLVRDCLAKRPDDRPASMTEVEERFLDAFPDTAVSGRPDRLTDRNLKSGTDRKNAQNSTGGTIPPPSTRSGFGRLSTPRSATGRAKTGAAMRSSWRPRRRRGVGIVVAGLLVVGLSVAAIVVPELMRRNGRHVQNDQTNTTQTDPGSDSPSTRSDPSSKGGLPIIDQSNGEVRPPRVNDNHYTVVRNSVLTTTDPDGQKELGDNNDGVLANDILPEGRPLDVECIEKTQFGDLAFNRDGTFRYSLAARPAADWPKADTFKYHVRLSGTTSWSKPATVTIEILPFTESEEAAIKRIQKEFGEHAVRRDERPPQVGIDLGEPTVQKPARDDTLSIFDPLAEVLREIKLDLQPITDAGVEHLASLTALRLLSLRGTDVSAAGVRRLSRLKGLTELDLSDTLLPDNVATALKNEAGRTSLNVIRNGAIEKLQRAGVQIAGLQIAGEPDPASKRRAYVATIPRSNRFPEIFALLKEAPRLSGIILTDADVTDDMLPLEIVRPLKMLRTMDLRGTLVSPKRKAKLEQEFPKLRIEWDSPLSQLRKVAGVNESGTNGAVVDLSRKKVGARTWTLLGQVEKLASLNLSGTPVDNEGLERLASLQGLRELVLEETPLTAGQVLAVCQRIKSLVSLDVEKAAIARDGKTLRLLYRELHAHSALASIRPEWARQIQDYDLTAADVLRERCHGCHKGAGSRGNHFNALVYETLRIPARPGLPPLVTPGKPAESLLWRKVNDGQMPEKGSIEAERMTSAEKEVLKNWIVGGAAEWPAVEPAAERPFIDIPQMLTSMRDDLQKVATGDRPFQRYFTLAHLYNQPRSRVSDGDLRLYRAALSKAINSLSWARSIVVPRAVDKEGTILAIDLRDLNWDHGDIWKHVIAANPYGLTYEAHKEPRFHDPYVEIVEQTKTGLPMVRADWFAAASTRPPLYAELLQLPSSAVELEHKLQVDIPRDFEMGLLMRAGIFHSAVANNGSRLLERHGAAYGAYWKTYDFAVGDEHGLLKSFPLGPAFPKNAFPNEAFRHAASEILFNLPNGMQAYLIVDGKDRRIDAGPSDLFTDPHKTSGTPATVPGLSCIACHGEGIKTEFSDEVRTAHVTKGEAARQVARLYPEAKLLRAKAELDRARFLSALQQAVGPFLQVGPDAKRGIETFDEPIAKAARYYWLDDLDGAAVAAELGIESPHRLKLSLEGNPWLLRERGLAALIQGGRLKRTDWEKGATDSTMQWAAKELDRGTPFKALAINRVDKRNPPSPPGSRSSSPQPEALKAPFDERAAKTARDAWASYVGSPPQATNSIGMKLQLIPPGEFQMGSEDTSEELTAQYPYMKELEEETPTLRAALNSSHPRHAVRLTKPFYIGLHEVTKGEFGKFVTAASYKTEAERDKRGGWGFDPVKDAVPRDRTLRQRAGFTWQGWGTDQSDDSPVVNVSWNDATAFCKWLRQQDGKHYRLPTEAEWEYACRAGTTTRFYNGDDPERLTEVGNVRDLTLKQRLFRWRNTLASADGAVYTSPVGHFRPNAFGLFDMHGNAAEWCADWFGRSYYHDSPKADPHGPTTGTAKIVRGGSWYSPSYACRSADRTANSPANRNQAIGFRVVCDVIDETAGVPATSPPVRDRKRLPFLDAPFTKEQAEAARIAWARSKDVEPLRTNSLGLTLALIPAGGFLMGLTQDEMSQVLKISPSYKKEWANPEQPAHRVRLDYAFWLGTREVTRGQFAQFVKATGYKTSAERVGGKGVGFDERAKDPFPKNAKYNWRNTGFQQDDNHPVVNVSWNDAAAFCEWLTLEQGETYRLPTEAEWEYACRAGTTTLYSTGDDPESLAGAANIADATLKSRFGDWATLGRGDGYVFTSPVGAFQPNVFGLFDMHGNVREWCFDWFSPTYEGALQVDPFGPASGASRVIRGGGWTDPPVACRSSVRNQGSTSALGLGLGFRVVALPPHRDPETSQ